MADYTPSVSPYNVPNDTDPPDVPTDFRDFAQRLTNHGFRARWNSHERHEGAVASQGGLIPGTLQPGFAGTVAAVAAQMDYGTYTPRALGFAYGFAVCGALGNCAGYIGVTNNIAGGSWMGKRRFHTVGNADSLFTLPVWSMFYYQPGNLPGVSLYATVDAAGTGLTVREAQIDIWEVPINQ